MRRFSITVLIGITLLIGCGELTPVDPEVGPPPPQSVKIISPANGDFFAYGETVTFAVQLSNYFVGNVERVRYYTNDSLYGEALTPPFIYIPTTHNKLPAERNLKVTAVVVNSLGLDSSTSDPVLISVTNWQTEQQNSLGVTMRITSPASGMSFSTGRPIVMTFSFSNESTNRPIQLVSIYTNNGLLDTNATSPFTTYTWTSATAGEYTLTATVKDASNIINSSQPVTISVTNRVPIRIISPTNFAQLVYTSSSISLASAVFPDSDESPTEVRYYTNDELLATSLNADINYSYSWSGMAPAIYAVKAAVVFSNSAGYFTTNYSDSKTVITKLADWRTGTNRDLNEVVMTMIGLPKGIVKMGESYRETTVNAFYISETEISYKKWTNVWAWGQLNGFYFSKGAHGSINYDGYRRDDNSLIDPVTEITWYDALVFCNALSRMENNGTTRTPVYFIDEERKTVYSNSEQIYNFTSAMVDWTGSGYRLPTEAEWEYACRAGSTNTYFWGNSLGSENYVYVNFQGANKGRTMPTTTSGEYARSCNMFGLFDTSGNVFEWCWDRYADYYDSSSTYNPRGPDTGSLRIIRGGSFASTEVFVTSDKRASMSAQGLSYTTGLRLVCNIPASLAQSLRDAFGL